ncbi:MAG: AAA family ATPase [Gammaproteobacteria bacterium]|nr:AAA family ATPase [Gammaproteobacteria bacterium]
MSSRHKEAMAHLSYGLSQGGCFIVLTGEVGTGKTTLCRNLLGDLPDNVDVALILNANIDERELLQTICDELKIPYALETSQKHLLDLIYRYLLDTFADNRHTVLIIDEAQLLNRDVLEQIRLLTNLETTKAKLLQIILIGQPELNELLSRNDLRQLAQRVTARYHLGSLRRSEIEEYINCRLGVAGCKQPLFSKQALNKLHALTDGIPRKINVLADHSLLAAYAKTQSLVDAKTVKAAAGDVFFDKALPGTGQAVSSGQTKWWLAAAMLILVNIGLWWFFTQPSRPLAIQTPQAGIADTDETGIQEVVAQLDNPGKPSTSIISGTVDQAPDAANTASASSDTLAQATLPPDADQDRYSEPDQQGVQISGVVEGVPGSVVIAENFLDATPEFPPEVAQSAIANQDVDVSMGAATDSQVAAGTDSSPPLATPSAVALQPSQGTAPTTTQGLPESEFGRLLETSADLTGRIAAFRTLAEIWQQDFPAQLMKPACQTVSELGLRCLGFSDWSQMLRYNRPAIIVVSHLDQLHRVIVRSVAGDSAEILVGGRAHSVAVDELRSRWTRDGVLFWKISEAGMGLRQFGQTNTDLVRVRAYLNRALTRARMPLLESLELPEFDLDMSQKVFALQTRFGIIDDSKIGPETYLLMNELVDPESTPVLNSRLP